MATAPARATRRRRVVIVAVIALTILGAGLRLYPLRFGYAHTVNDYDGGVYFGSALDLLNGRLPYRDYVLVHPPVIMLVFSPLALLAKWIGAAQAMALATVSTGLAGAASVPLMAKLVWHRGAVAAVLAAGLVAVQDDAVGAAYTPLLEPWLVLFCLLGAALIFRRDQVVDGRRLWWGGALLGVACATKIWAFAIVLAVVLAVQSWSRIRPLLGGVAVGFLVPVLPFALTAPGAFVRDVFVAQVFRSSEQARTSAVYRLLHLFSVSPTTASLPDAGRNWLIGSALVIAVLLALSWLALRGRSTALDRFAVASAVLVTAMMFTPGTFYTHYTAFAVPFLVLAAVVPLRRLPRRTGRVWAAVLALSFVGLTFTMVHRDQRGFRPHRQYQAFDALVPAGSCVITTQVSSLIAADRFPGGSCPGVLDSFGTALALADGRAPSTATLSSSRIEAVWVSALRRADFVYVVRRDTPVLPVEQAFRDYLATQFRVVPSPGIDGTLYQRIH